MPMARGCHLTTQHWAAWGGGWSLICICSSLEAPPTPLATGVRRGLAGRLPIGCAPGGGAHTPWRHGGSGPGHNTSAWARRDTGRAGAQGPSGAGRLRGVMEDASLQALSTRHLHVSMSANAVLLALPMMADGHKMQTELIPCAGRQQPYHKDQDKWPQL